LPAHFSHDGARRLADRVHAERCEHEGQQAADEETDDDLGIVQRKFEGVVAARRNEVGAQFLHVGTKENERGQAGRGDRISLRYRLHRIPDGVQLVGNAANFLWQITHDRDAARVIGDRTKGIEGDNDSGHGKHAHDGDGDAIQTGEMKAQQDRDADKTDGERGRVLTNGQPGDDVRGVTGLGGLGDLADRRVGGRRVVISDYHNNGRHQQSYERSEVEIVGRTRNAADRDRVGKEHVRRGPEQDGGNKAARSDCSHQHCRRLSAAEVHE
jgi:hypothetical protein